MFQTNVPYRRQGSPLRTWSTVFSVVAALAAVGSAVDHADARGPGGGGFGGGGFRGGGGFSRPSGGVFNGGGMRAPQQRGTAQKPNRSASASKATANGSGNSNRQTAARGNGNTGVAGSGNTANANSGVVGSGNGSGNGNHGAVNNGNVNTGTVGSGNVNTGNVVAGNDVDVSVNSGWSGYGYTYPAGTGAAYATGVAMGTATTAAVAGYTIRPFRRAAIRMPTAQPIFIPARAPGTSRPTSPDRPSTSSYRTPRRSDLARAHAAAPLIVRVTSTHKDKEVT